jgi:peptide/nickel transport system substrate-binding protein
VSTDAPRQENNYVGQNIIRYQNPDYDALIAKYLSTIPKNDRLQVLGEMVHFSTDQLLLVPLYHEPEPVLISNRLVNASGRRGDGIQTWNVQDWDVKS